MFLGTIAPDKGQPPPRIEALYTDCDGRVYLMDTGKDVSTAEGNRLLRFTGDYIKGDLGYEVITDLQKAALAPEFGGSPRCRESIMCCDLQGAERPQAL